MNKIEFRKKELRALVAKRLFNDFLKVAGEAINAGFQMKIVNESGDTLPMRVPVASGSNLRLEIQYVMEYK